MARDPGYALNTRISLYLAAVALVSLPFLIIVAWAVATGLSGSFPWFELILMIPFLTYYVTSVYIVQEDHVAGIFVLQQYAWEIGPGVYFVPRFITEVGDLPVSFEQDQFPGDPERISKQRDDLALNGLLRPFRTPTAGSEPGDSDDPLNTRMTLEPTASVVWRLRRRSFFEMWIRVPGKTWPEKKINIRKQMYDSLHSMLGKSVAKRTPAQIFEQLEEIDLELEMALQIALEKFGVEIDRVEMQPPDLTHAVNIALAGISEARAQKQAGITRAEEEKQSEILRQEGIALGRERLSEADRKERQNRGVGDMEAAKALGMSGADFRAGEIAKETIGEGTMVLGVEGIAQAMGLGKLILGDKKGAAA